LHELEIQLTEVFKDAYGLDAESVEKIKIQDITLNCNPIYRYGVDKTDDEYEENLLRDSINSLLSYSVGCMFGRYSLDKPYLILANQGDTLETFLSRIPLPTFTPDEDNIIPVLNEEYFSDDIVGRFKEFLKVSFGEDHYTENLKFIEDALGKDIRKYFLKDFYNDHIKRYKKRPIYWMFSSPKGSFNALIYMHRYQPDTVSKLLNDYLREFMEKLRSQRTHHEKTSIREDIKPAQKTKANREITRINKVLKELEEYEQKVIYPLALEKIEIDLDDGVLVNYKKFGKALKKITGLSGKI
jgi:type II restriction/modification system DNA methylase subunit YeeA